MAGIFPVETRGVGKPDYSREVSSARERRGLRLAYKQSLTLAGIVFSSIYTGTHTAAVHATVMTDAAAHFTASALQGLTILNISDGSSGIIIANTETMVTVIALTGGFSNQWNPGDIYYIPSPFAWVQPPLIPGATAHLVDNFTGQTLPLTVPEGYTMTLIAAGAGFTQDTIAYLYFDGLLIMSGGVLGSGKTVYENYIVGISTATIDPTGTSSHTLDVQVTNLGGANLEGGMDWTGILEAVGTPPLPSTKVIRCRHCGHEETVPVEQTKLICPKCKMLTMVYNLRYFKETA